MKIKKLLMEEWLAENQFVKYNLAESGTPDFDLGTFLDTCNEQVETLRPINLFNPDSRGSIRLRREISACYEQAGPDNILVTNGISESLFCFFNQVLEAGDEVVVGFPAFQSLYQLPEAIGCRVKFMNVLDCDNFIPTPEKIGALITPRTRLVIVNTPHNPTGSTIDAAGIKALAHLARGSDIYFLFDEHYRFLPLGDGVGLLPSGYDIFRGIHDRVAATGSVTKCFGLNGLRVGWLVADPHLLQGCRDYKDYTTHVTPPINDYLAALSLKNKETIIRIKKEALFRNLSLLKDFMNRFDDIFDFVEPTGGVVCFPGVKGDIDTGQFCRRLLSKYDVSLLPGFAFEVDGRFRLNFSLHPEIFEEALGLMAECCRDIRKKHFQLL